MEGPSDDPEIERLRNRQVKNFLTVTLLSIGMPMILMGDEARRSQCGNNDAYCQDNEISWFVQKHADVHRFVTLLNERRFLRDVEYERQRVTLDELLQEAGKHGTGSGSGSLTGARSRSLAFEAELRRERLRIYLMLNAYSEPLEFELPPAGEGVASWRRWIDTAPEAPQDIVPWEAAPTLSGLAYPAAAYSVVVLVGEIRRRGTLGVNAGDTAP